MGRSIVTLLVMLVAFAAIAAFFVALDTASGVRLHAPAIFAGAPPSRTATPISRTRTPAATALPTASPTATRAAPRATPSAAPSVPAGVVTPTAAAITTANGTPTAATIATIAGTPTTAAIAGTPTTAAVTMATDTSTAAATASAAGTPEATASAAGSTPALPVTGATATPMPSPPGGITPPRYGTLPNYPNNTTFGPAMMQALDARIIVLTNQERAARGLPALTESPVLDVIAAARSEDLVKRNYFDHYDPTGPVDAQGHHAAAVQELLARNGIPYAEVGENLIGRSGFPLDAHTPAQVVQAWMHHPEHRANILHAAYSTIGVGMAVEDQTGGLRVVITQVFLR